MRKPVDEFGSVLDALEQRLDGDGELVQIACGKIAQAKRLGHRIAGVRGIYGHVTPAMQHRIVTALQDRWRATQARPHQAERHLRVA